MKKLLSLLLTLILSLSLSACVISLDNDDDDKTEKNPISNVKPDDDEKDEKAEKLEKYLNENKETFLTALEKGFISNGQFTCESDLELIDYGFVVTIKINELENVDASLKASLQEGYDSMDAQFESYLITFRTEAPELEYLKFVICDKTGDVLASVTADGTVEEVTETPAPATPVAPAAGYKFFEFSGIIMEIPENFQETEANGLKMFYTDKYPEVTDNINFISTSGKATLADCSKALLEKSYESAFEGTGAQFEITGYRTFDIDGKDAVECKISVTLNGVSMAQTQYIILLDKSFVTVTFTDASKQYTAEFNKIAASIKVK